MVITMSVWTLFINSCFFEDVSLWENDGEDAIAILYCKVLDNEPFVAEGDDGATAILGSMVVDMANPNH